MAAATAACAWPAQAWLPPVCTGLPLVCPAGSTCALPNSTHLLVSTCSSAVFSFAASDLPPPALVLPVDAAGAPCPGGAPGGWFVTQRSSVSSACAAGGCRGVAFAALADPPPARVSLRSVGLELNSIAWVQVVLPDATYDALTPPASLASLLLGSSAARLPPAADWVWCRFSRLNVSASVPSARWFDASVAGLVTDVRASALPLLASAWDAGPELLDVCLGGPDRAGAGAITAEQVAGVVANATRRPPVTILSRGALVLNLTLQVGSLDDVIRANERLMQAASSRTLLRSSGVVIVKASDASADQARTLLTTSYWVISAVAALFALVTGSVGCVRSCRGRNLDKKPSVIVELAEPKKLDSAAAPAQAVAVGVRARW